MSSAATLPRLTRSALPALQTHLLSPQWREPGIGIVHLGIGNFHRAHQALYTEEAMLAAGGDWGICGVTLQGDVGKRDALMEQQGLYSLVDGDVALGDPGVAHDLAHPLAPRTVPGILVAALRARRDAADGKPFTVLSCDNLAHNGAALRQVVCSFARQVDAALADWIAAEVAFPSTMVDRIVPATTDAERATVAEQPGYRDAAPVPCEPFRQWVIEDRFSGGRPAWDAVGAQLVDDVTPFELAKLRMLNGTHSTLAYLSMLGGFATIDAAIADPAMRSFIHTMMTQEIAPTLTMPASFDLPAYRDALLTRYANPALKHRCAQIAMDGSQKIPPRLLATIEARIDAGQPFARLALAVAAWMMFLRGHADDGTRYDVSDPLADELKALAASAQGEPQALMNALLSVREVFPAKLAARAEFRTALRGALQLLRQNGARGAVAAVQ